VSVAAAVLAVGAAPAASATPPAPYTFPRTEVHSIRAATNGQDYVLYVALPRNHGVGRRFPAVYTLDADYAFAVARNVIEHFSDRGDLPEMIVVGISYPGGIEVLDDYRRNRSRDYTPSHTLEGGYGPAFQGLSGGGPCFRDALERDILPFVEARFPADPADRTLVGHSYGGLFATWVLLTRPELFRRYVAVSPSLWYDRQAIFEVERRTADGRRGATVDVFLGVGSLENRAMADDLRALSATLRGRGHPGLHVIEQVFDDETHNSVFPAAFTRGIRAVRRP
jgi:predicted alpha/beta superfamily hydrolase